MTDRNGVGVETVVVSGLPTSPKGRLYPLGRGPTATRFTRENITRTYRRQGGTSRRGGPVRRSGTRRKGKKAADPTMNIRPTRKNTTYASASRRSYFPANSESKSSDPTPPSASPVVSPTALTVS